MKIIILLLLSAFAALATDIIPNPTSIGSVGNPTNVFATAYATNFYGRYTGNGAGITNLAGAMQPYSTNVTLVGATSLTINFTAFTDGSTNFSVTAPNELMGAVVTNRTSTNFTVGFTATTITAQTIEGAVIHR
jgi:hypothetical protein